MTIYDVFMSMEQRDGNCHKMSQVVINCRDVCRRLSWRFFSRPLPAVPFLVFAERRLWLCLGSVPEFCRKVPGKLRENCWKTFPKSRSALNSRISGTGKGKTAANVGSTLPWTLCRPSVRGVSWNRQLQPSRALSENHCVFKSQSARSQVLPQRSQKKSPENRSDFLGPGIEIAAFPRFQNRSVFGILRSLARQYGCWSKGRCALPSLPLMHQRWEHCSHVMRLCFPLPKASNWWGDVTVAQTLSNWIVVGFHP